MSGLARLPALCFGDGFSEVEVNGLQSYEVSPVEPLHDLKGHIKNVWELLPTVLPEVLKESFEQELKLLLGNKDSYRGKSLWLTLHVN